MEDILGKRFGNLVVKMIYKKKINYNLMVKCLCDCGNTKKMRYSNLKTGQSSSCGCREGNKVPHKLSKEDLEKLYIKNRLSLRDISSHYLIPNCTILRWMKEYGIPRRTPTQSRKMTAEVRYMKSLKRYR